MPATSIRPPFKHARAKVEQHRKSFKAPSWKKQFTPEQLVSIKAFLELFPYRYSYLYANIKQIHLTDHLKEPSPLSWLTTQHPWPLTDRDIIKSLCYKSDKIYGCRAGFQQSFAVLDLDADGEYHNLDSMKQLGALLKKAGLKYIVYQSSESGGWHLYIHFGFAPDSTAIHLLLKDLLEYSGFIVRNGNLEIFPNRGKGAGSKGFGLRIPLQHGFSFLNQTALLVSHDRCELSTIDAISYFLGDRASHLNSKAAFRKAARYAEKQKNASKINAYSGPSNIQGGGKLYNKITTDVNQESTLTGSRYAKDNIAGVVLSNWKRQPKGIDIDRWLKGREYYQTGLTKPSQRSDALFSINHYLFYGDKSLGIRALGYGFEEERIDLMINWLDSKHNGFSEEVNSGMHGVYEQIRRLVYSNSKGKKSYFSGPYREANDRKAREAQDKIKSKANELRDLGVKSQKAFSKLANVDIKTARKYKPLWQHLLTVYELRIAGVRSQLARETSKFSNGLVSCR